MHMLLILLLFQSSICLLRYIKIYNVHIELLELFICHSFGAVYIIQRYIQNLTVALINIKHSVVGIIIGYQYLV